MAVEIEDESVISDLRQRLAALGDGELRRVAADSTAPPIEAELDLAGFLQEDERARFTTGHRERLRLIRKTARDVLEARRERERIRQQRQQQVEQRQPSGPAWSLREIAVGVGLFLVVLTVLGGGGSQPRSSSVEIEPPDLSDFGRAGESDLPPSEESIEAWRRG